MPSEAAELSRGHQRGGEAKREPREAFRDRQGRLGREVAPWLWRMECGLRLRELAEAAELGHYGSVSRANQASPANSGLAFPRATRRTDHGWEGCMTVAAGPKRLIDSFLQDS